MNLENKIFESWNKNNIEHKSFHDTLIILKQMQFYLQRSKSEDYISKCLFFSKSEWSRKIQIFFTFQGFYTCIWDVSTYPLFYNKLPLNKMHRHLFLIIICCQEHLEMHSSVSQIWYSPPLLQKQWSYCRFVYEYTNTTCI